MLSQLPTILPRCGAAAYRNAATQSVSSGATDPLTFDTEVYDTDGFHDTGSNTSRFTVPTGKDGIYLLQASTFNTAGGSVSSMGFQKNGSAVLGSGKDRPLNGSTYCAATAVLYLVAGDYVEVTISATGGTCVIGHASIADAMSFMAVARISA